MQLDCYLMAELKLFREVFWMAEKADEQQTGQQKSNVVRFQRRFAVFTDENDQITELAPDWKRKRKLGVNWMAFYQDSLRWLATENLPNEQYRVLLYLLGKLDFENYIRIPQKDVAEALGMKRPAVTRAIGGLLKRDVLARIKIGTANTYRLNPYVGYKGKDPTKTVIEYDELKRRKERKGED